MTDAHSVVSFLIDVFNSQQHRGTQLTVSVNVCLEDLLSPTVFGLKCDEKLKYSLVQIFVIWGKQCLLFFGEIKMSF